MSGAPKNESPGSGQTLRGAGTSGTTRNQSNATGSILKPRRPAPYARQVAAGIRPDREPNVFVFAGSDAWNMAENRRRNFGVDSALVLPPGDDPDGFRWPPLDAIVAIPGDCDGARFRALVRALLRDGVRCVVEIRPGRRAPVAHYATAAGGVQ